MLKRNLYLNLILVIICFTCVSKTSDKVNTDSDIIPLEIIKQNCERIDENKIFNDTTWFLAYINADVRSSTKAIFEQWECRLDEKCKMTLTLYEDSTYIDFSPCEWDFAFSGYYRYVCDTLYCIEIGIEDTDNGGDYSPKVKWLLKYIKNHNKLEFIWRKKQIFKDDFYTINTHNKVIYEKQN